MFSSVFQAYYFNNRKTMGFISNFLRREKKVYFQAYVFNNRNRLKIFPSDLYCCAIYLNQSPLFHK